MSNETIERQLEELRSRVRERLDAAPPMPILEGMPTPEALELPDAPDLEPSDRPNVAVTGHLEQVNANAVISAPIEIRSDVKLLGPVIDLLRRLARPFVQPFIDPYISRQERFNAEATRHLNELGRRMEKRFARVNTDVARWAADPAYLQTRLEAALSDYDFALRQRHTLLFDALDEEIGALQNQVADAARDHGQQLQGFEERFTERAIAVDRRFEEKDGGIAALNDALTGQIRQLGRDLAESDAALTAFALAEDVQLSQQQLGRDIEATDRYVDRVFATLRDITGMRDKAELMENRTVIQRMLEELEQHAATVPAEESGSRPAPPPQMDGALWAQLRGWMADDDYRAFQGQFRGNLDEIAERMRGHLKWFKGRTGPVADLGCGRGEFLELLEAAGHEAIGVEINAVEVQDCTSRGLTAVESDLFTWLEERDEGSLGGIFLAQVIEHLAPPDWTRFLQLAASRLQPGGTLVVETINPQSLYAIVRAYVIDPTHVRPVHPELLAFLAGRVGLVPTIHYQSPVPDEERPLEIETGPGAVDGEQASLLRAINDRLERIDRLCCEPQEYALVAVKGGGPDVGP